MLSFEFAVLFMLLSIVDVLQTDIGLKIGFVENNAITIWAFKKIGLWPAYAIKILFSLVIAAIILIVNDVIFSIGFTIIVSYTVLSNHNLLEAGHANIIFFRHGY